MAQQTFKVGEIAILHSLPAPVSFMNGMECVIEGPLELRRVVDVRGIPSVMHCYMIGFHGGFAEYAAAAPQNLKKKPGNEGPDAVERNSRVDWKDCAWQPKEAELA